MSEFRWWAFWRRVQYSLAFLVIFAGAGAGAWYAFDDTTYNCFDGILNGEEVAVDCGGNCVRVCAAAVESPTVLWAKSFKITEGQYNAVAYIENTNDIAGVETLPYKFEFYSGNDLVGTKSGTTVLPPDSIYPIFEGRISLNENITETRLIIENRENLLWQPATAGRTQFITSDISLTGADDKPRLDVTVENTALTPAENVEVVATLFSGTGEPLTASETFIEYIGAREESDLVFTWPNSIAKTVRSCIIPTDVLLAIDLSGSMNNDGGTPPEPITSALQAASTFIEQLSPVDQSGVITFATDARLSLPLSDDHETTASQVRGLSISPQDETGYTNATFALKLALNELSSERHNINARRVLVLLTDGQPTSANDPKKELLTTIQNADALEESGATIYAIGLGSDVDAEFIKEIASNESTAFIAPNRSDLASIYETITSSICESGTARVEVVAKTRANFTPLR